MEPEESLKEQGNGAFREGNYLDAIDLYTLALKTVPNENDISTLYKNRAQAFLKQEQYVEALEDCNSALEISSFDPKALYRRSQAYENLGRFEEAYYDARQVLNLDPDNEVIQPILERLHKIVHERAKKNAQITTKIDSMIKYGFDLTTDVEKRETALNNLLVLARDGVGADIIIKANVLQKIKQLLKVEKRRSIIISVIRLVGELCRKSVEYTKVVIKDIGLPWFLEVIDSDDQDQVNSVEHCMQIILNTFSGMDNKPETRPNKDLCERYKFQIDTLLSCLVYSLNNHVISGIARDAIIELLMKNIHYTQLNWAERLIEIGGVERLLECASELEEYKYESSMNITPSTHTIASVCLARVYENMYYDAIKEKFVQKIQDFISSKLLSPDIESKVQVTVAIMALLKGPTEVGNSIVAKEGIMEMILVMANTDDPIQQKAAVECIIAAASKADKAKAILNQGIDILKKLYKSSQPAIQIRALVGLCKLASSGGDDASIKPFADGSILKLAEACRRFLLNSAKDNDLRKWAAEGLAYLTLDAEVKEKLVEDKPALQALIELAKTGDQSVLYGVITTLVNLCNAYEKQEVLPEMVELAKFAKQHIPEVHELDDPDFISKRILALGHENVASALVALSKTESNNSRELIARVFNALCSEQELRGPVVQQGGVKVLIKLAHNGTEKGRRQASQALARIGITIDPEVAFPGQRSLEVVRPLLNLLHQDFNALENFEALMALCNVAQVSEESRQRILKEGGLSKIDHYLFEDHLMLQRAAMQVITNLTMSPDVIRIYEGNNDRMKYLVILCMDEDPDTSLAASGAIAILTSSSKTCCEKMFDCNSWLESLQWLLVNADMHLRYRGVCIVRNMMESSKEAAEKITETNILEILMALMKSVEEGLGNIKVITEAALKAAESWGIIKSQDSTPVEK